MNKMFVKMPLYYVLLYLEIILTNKKSRDPGTSPKEEEKVK